MLTKRQFLLLSTSSCIFVFLFPFGAIGSLITYLFVSCLAAYSFLVLTKEKFYSFTALAILSFSISQILDYLENPASDWVAMFGYANILATCTYLYKKRVRKIEKSFTLEVSAYAGIVLMLIVMLNSFLQFSSARIIIQLTSLVAILIGLSFFLGRKTNLLVNSFMVAIFMAAFLEMVNLPELHYNRIWSLCYFPVLFGLGLDESNKNLVISKVPARRKFGPTQQFLFYTLLIAPILLIAINTLWGNDENLWTLTLLGSSVVALLMLRFRLLVKLRDWSYIQESKLRQYSDDITNSFQDEQELNKLTVEALYSLVGEQGSVALLEKIDNKTIVLEQIKNEFRGSRFKSLHFGDALAAASPWFTHKKGTSQFALEVPQSQVYGASQTIFAAEIPGAVEADLEEHFRSATTQYSLALKAEALAEQIQEERANNRFNTLSQDSNDMVFLVDYETKQINFAGTTVERLGYKRDDYLDQPILSYVFEDDIKAAKQFLSGSYKKKSRRTIDIRLRQKDTDARWYAMSIRDLSDSDDLNGLLLNFSDIHDRKLSDLNLRNSEARFRSLVQNSSDVSLLVDNELTVSFVSPNITSVFQLDTQHLTGTSLLSFLKACSHKTLQQAIHNSQQTNRPIQTEVEIQNSLGSGYKLASVTIAQSELDEKDMFVLTMRDISNTRQLEDSLRKQALYDDLTGLLNRNAFVHEVQVAIKNLASSQAAAVAVLNIRDFKEINDSIGFAAGDRVLALVASRLQSTLRGDDILCRLSADEFAVLSQVKDASKAMHLAQIITDSFDEPFALEENQQHPLEVSVGVAITSRRNTSPSELVQQALVAMHRSKTANEDNKPTLFTKEMQQEAVDRFELAADLRRALDQDEFNLVYQPLISLNDNTVHSFEALLRWNHPTRGNISPAVFIPLAESNGMIIEIGRWVLRHACAKLIEWQTLHREFKNTSIAVNLSARQLDIEGELGKLVDIINEVGINPTNLTIELTESVMVDDADKIRSQLEHLRGMGISIAIDDFGTGVNGLAHLRDFPFDIIKIDKVYIDQIGQTDEGTKLVQQLVELSKGVGAKKVVAEGIETPDQAEILIQMGCHIGQGFYLARPMAEDKLITWLQVRRTGELLGA